MLHLKEVPPAPTLFEQTFMPVAAIIVMSLAVFVWSPLRHSSTAITAAPITGTQFGEMLRENESHYRQQLAHFDELLQTADATGEQSMLSALGVE